jgi:predicted SAM-dependent methyltransferase
LITPEESLLKLNKMPNPKMLMLNIGCGTTHHPDWINLDVSTTEPSVLQVDINSGLPFPADSITVCYSSHLLEHLDLDDVRKFLAECMRVLKRGGLIRLAVPDLESIAREYLRLLEVVATGDKIREFDYDWIMLEMYDQTVRNYSGGEMAHFLENLNVVDRPFVKSRIGVEAENFWGERITPKQSWTGLTARKRLWNYLKRFHMKLVGCIIFLLAGKSARRNFQAGIFRSSGEVHQWMYDRFSLKRLLERAGFVDVNICTATGSRIPEYEKYSLDTLNGVTRKPDSLYIEASKP